jgi:diguanylate cyclase (GGDEF)-like protein/PAS domain S-box-containing protein
VNPHRRASGRRNGVAADRERDELADAVEHAPVGMHWTACDGTILRVNAMARDLLGRARAELLGRPLGEVIGDAQLAGDLLHRLRAGEHLQDVELPVRQPDGRLRWVLVDATARSALGRCLDIHWVTRDATDQRHDRDRLVHEALHDPLTGLPNRTSFVARAEEALERARLEPGRRCALLFLTFESYHAVGHGLGHVAGDAFLREVAARLRLVKRPSDHLARLSGDEFTLLLDPVSGPAEVERTARRLRRCLASPVHLAGRHVSAAASIGAAISGAETERAEDLLRDADLAMHQAQGRAGTPYQLFDVSMRARARDRFALESDLQAALERHEFHVAFQPIVDLRTGGLQAFEVLLRWHHPERGVVPPGDFVPLAEETGLIVPIGEWVLHEACWHARRWEKAFPLAPPVRISVNISARQLEHPGFVRQVRTALHDSGLAPQRLRLEITESALIGDVESSVALLDRCRALRVELHMDDFGTGYASLSNLPRFPLQTIKIDKGFVQRMAGRRTDREIVRTVVELARRLGLHVIAEGVETPVQRDRLLELGCELGQGFLFSAPLSPPDAAAFLRTSARPPQ